MKFNFTMYNAPAVAVRILVYMFVAIIVDKSAIGWSCAWNKLISVTINDTLFEFY